MTNVITRPHKSATAVITEATAVVPTATTIASGATPVTPPLAPVTAAAPSMEEGEIAKVKAAYADVASYLTAASMTGKPHQHSGEPDRLLRAAAEIASNRAQGQFSLSALKNDAWTVSALIRASRMVPGDEEAEERGGSIEGAARLLAWMLDSTLDEVMKPYARRAEMPGHGQRITRDTQLSQGGTVARDLVTQCAVDIESLSDFVITFPDRMESDDAQVGPLLRAIGVRIKQLNGAVMSYLGEEHVTLRDAHNAMYRYATQLPEGELQ